MKHKDIAIAWLNGEEIQVKYPNVSGWEDLRTASNSRVCGTFNDDCEYRIKPKIPEYRLYRPFGEKVIYCVQRNTGWLAETNHVSVTTSRADNGLIEWLTPWLTLPKNA